MCTMYSSQWEKIDNTIYGNVAYLLDSCVIHTKRGSVYINLSIVKWELGIICEILNYMLDGIWEAFILYAKWIIHQADQS